MVGANTSRGYVLRGYSLASALVLIACIVVGYSMGELPVEYIGYLGLVPIFLGLKALAGNFRQGRADAEPVTGRATGAIAIATILGSNSVDTILVISPLLGDTEARLDYVIVAAYVVVAIAWYVLAAFLHSRADRLAWSEAVARWVAPLIMIVVGLYILDNTLTDTLAGH